MSAYRPRSVFCIIDAAHRDVERAEQIANGRFQLAGTTLDLGTRPDWLGGPFPVDDEWRIELSKFYYGLDLAHAYQESGDRRFVDCWLDLVTSWIGQVPIDHDPTDVIARRVQNWTYAWVRIADAGAAHPAIGPAESCAVLSSIGDQVEHLRNNLAAERNHRTLELYALLVAGLAHPVLDTDGELVRFAAFELYRNLRADVLADGVHRERSTHYHAVALRSFVGTRLNADRFDVCLPADFDDRLAAASDFLANVIRPDGSLPMLSDSDDGDYSDLLALAADCLDRPDLEWVATHGKQGRPPERTDRSYGDGGYHVQRSGWGDGSTPYEEERQLIFDCGPVGDSGHGHYDALHIEVAACGRPLLVDPGRYTYSEQGAVNWRHWFKGTAAHNTVCVDGLDQVAYRRGKPKGPISQTRFLGRRETHGVVSLTGEVVSPLYDAVHLRRVRFVDRRWWLIEDTLRAVDKHRYDLRFHLPPTDHGRLNVVAGRVDAPNMTLLIAEPHGAAVSVEQGWSAAEYGVRRRAPVISISPEVAGGTADALFLTAVVPIAGPRQRPSLVSADQSRLIVDFGSSIEQVEFDGDEVRWSQC